MIRIFLFFTCPHIYCTSEMLQGTFVKESRRFDVTRDIWLSEDVYFISERSIKLKLSGSDISYATTSIVGRHQFRADCRIPKTLGKFVIPGNIGGEFRRIRRNSRRSHSFFATGAWITRTANFRVSDLVFVGGGETIMRTTFRTIYVLRKRVYYVRGVGSTPDRFRDWPTRMSGMSRALPGKY